MKRIYACLCIVAVLLGVAFYSSWRVQKFAEDISDDIDNAMEAIRDEDIIVNFHGNRQAEAELLYSLMEAGIPVSGFIREQGDLESIFMQITSHDKGKVVLSSEE